MATTNEIQPQPLGVSVPPISKFGAVLRVTSGNFLEQFDFFLFGFYATYIAKTFFPGRQRIRLADADLRGVRRRFPDAPAWCDSAWRVYRQGRAPARPDRHAVDHGERHDPHRVRSRAMRRSACWRRRSC